MKASDLPLKRGQVTHETIQFLGIVHVIIRDICVADIHARLYPVRTHTLDNFANGRQAPCIATLRAPTHLASVMSLRRTYHVLNCQSHALNTCKQVLDAHGNPLDELLRRCLFILAETDVRTCRRELTGYTMSGFSAKHNCSSLDEGCKMQGPYPRCIVSSPPTDSLIRRREVGSVRCVNSTLSCMPMHIESVLKF